MSYVHVAIILLTFLFLWSRLPDPKSETTRPEAETAREGSHAMKVHPDQIGEPDEHGRIKVGVPLGADLPVIPGYTAWRVYLEHLAYPPRIVTYNRVQSHV